MRKSIYARLIVHIIITILPSYSGGPDYKEASLITYRIAVDCGNDIDPVYSKDLTFFYSRDPVITSFKIEEWKK